MARISWLPLTALFFSTSAFAIPDDFEFDLEGYYRTRGYAMGNLVEGQEDAGTVMLQRLRLQPQIDFQGRAKFFMQMDLLDDSAWGDNSSLASTALFGDQPSNVGASGSDVDSYGRSYDTMHLNRAWMEFDLPIGVMRVGRQESHWGMGLLANHGNGFDDLFGENHAGATFDRIMFATKPIAIAQTIMGRPVSDIPLFMAFGVDRIVEEPLVDYYGYTCEEDIEEGDASFDSRCDSDGDGWTDLDHDYTNEDRTFSQRGDDWWLDNTDDVVQLLGVLIYKGEGLNWGGEVADLTLGAYGIIRNQEETDSQAIIWDGYTKLSWKKLMVEGEVVHIGGNTRAITLDGAYDAYGDVEDPLYKDVDIWGYVAKVGRQTQPLDLVFEHGYASGDDNVADELFTGRAIHEDYNVGLLLYEEILSRVTARSWSEKGRSLWSKGGVYNSRYVYPHFRLRPLNNWELRGAFLMAWPDKPDGARIRCSEKDKESLGIQCTDPQEDLAAHLGWEADLGLHHRFHEHILFAVEGAVARTTNRLPLENIGLNPAGEFWTVQTRFAFEF
jgi:hypothetical protein